MSETAIKKEKARKYNLEYKKKNKEELKRKRPKYREKNSFKISQQVRERKFRNRYGITIAEYNLLCASQDFCCAICEEQVIFPKTLNVDHDHASGEIRGLLCGSCNRGIGLLKDKKEIVKRAFIYLEEHEL